MHVRFHRTLQHLPTTAQQHLPATLPLNTTQHHPSTHRRALLLSLPLTSLLYTATPCGAGVSYGSTDAGTIINSVLGAYGIPSVANKGSGVTWALYDDFDNEYVFEYPKQGWVRRSNTLRQGIVISNFQTADKAVVEVFTEGEPSSRDLVYTAVERVLYPGVEIGGNSKLELPARDKIKSEDVVIDGQKYTYLAFTSDTLTRSGYQIKHKNLAVVAQRKGTCYVLCASSRSDLWDADKQALLSHMVESFRLR